MEKHSLFIVFEFAPQYRPIRDVSEEVKYSSAPHRNSEDLRTLKNKRKTSTDSQHSAAYDKTKQRISRIQRDKNRRFSLRLPQVAGKIIKDQKE